MWVSGLHVIHLGGEIRDVGLHTHLKSLHGAHLQGPHGPLSLTGNKPGVFESIILSFLCNNVQANPEPSLFGP